MKVYILVALFFIVQPIQMTTQSLPIDTITLGSGCFWCTEAVFQQLKGVIKTESGYAGGKLSKPSYWEVSTGLTGHAEVVRISYDPEQISLEQILEVFWKTHDPTTLNRQGADVGTQYRSVIFYHNQQQKETAQRIKQALEDEEIWDKPIVTEITALKSFYKAEDTHQNFYNTNPAHGYCQFVIVPKLDKFRKLFSELSR
ncbi:MAG: peptide-methionine (S)-S-oxide reductase MsrA [Bacteroidales bacterium]|nr:peptide-methionine (S)-S-oxide reductase MsrA [Bacteroidales bacterium]